MELPWVRFPAMEKDLIEQSKSLKHQHRKENLKKNLRGSNYTYKVILTFSIISYKQLAVN